MVSQAPRCWLFAPLNLCIGPLAPALMGVDKDELSRTNVIQKQGLIKALMQEKRCIRQLLLAPFGSTMDSVVVLVPKVVTVGTPGV